MVKRIKQVKIVISHIEHYIDIHKYVEYPKFNTWFKKTDDGYYTMKDNATKRDKYIIDRIRKLEEYHWGCIWKLISKNAQSWWT